MNKTVPLKFCMIPSFAIMVKDGGSFSIEWFGEDFTYIFNSDNRRWEILQTEDATAGATSAGDIATYPEAGFGHETGSVDDFFNNTKKFYKVDKNKKKVDKNKKKVDKDKKKLKEDATPGATNMATISNDFGTDPPRLPSVTWSLDGKKSLGMGSNFVSYNMTVRDMFTGKQFDLLRVLNKDGIDTPGDSNQIDPILYGPYNNYVPDLEFIMKDEEERIKKYQEANKEEFDREHYNRKLTDMLQFALLKSIGTKVDFNE